MVSLEAKGFDFVPLLEEDLPFLLSIRNECHSCLHDDRVFSLDDATKWFREKRPVFFIIVHEGIHIGYFRTANHQGKSLMIGADLAEKYRGRGLGFAAYTAFIPFIKSRFGVSVLKLEVLGCNHRAIHLYEKLGFREVGRSRATHERDGCVVDNIFMELIA